MNKLANAKTLLKYVRGQTSCIGVAYSGGKDSLVCMDLCCKIFDRVEAFHAVRIFDMKIVEDLKRFVLKRWKVDLKIYPWFLGTKELRARTLMPDLAILKKVPRLDQKEIENRLKFETNVEWMVWGWRASDSITRAIGLSHCGGIDVKFKRVFPLRRWNRDDIYSYLRLNNIPYPFQLGGAEQAGIDLHPRSIAFLKNYYPTDYEKFLEVYPYAGARVEKTAN